MCHRRTWVHHLETPKQGGKAVKPKFYVLVLESEQLNTLLDGVRRHHAQAEQSVKRVMDSSGCFGLGAIGPELDKINSLLRNLERQKKRNEEEPEGATR